MSRRLMPVAVAVLVLAVIATALWWFNRSTAIPSALPKSAPAVGSCWDVDAHVISDTLPWPGDPVACTAPHTAEIFYTGQVDHALLKAAKTAKGSAAQVNDVLIQAEARSGCSGHVAAYLGGPWRGAQVSLIPTFLTPKADGFFACTLAQVSDPGGTHIVTRSASLKGAVTDPKAADITIDCYADAADGAPSFTPCAEAHSGEYVGTFTVTPLGAPYNGAELQTTVTQGCQSLVDRFVGLPAGAKSRTDLRASYVGPTSSLTWVGSDQSFACYASTSTPIRGSIKGLGTAGLPR